ncbi:glycosyltransferase family 52 [Sulfitobacter sp. 1A16808]|uniref:glycosyltransferase family 52 n=1 Tax=Sulfitobacter sp. 1A16808 TaxID=3368572 RepID=UPI003744D946
MKEAISIEKIETYDLLYFTQHNSSEDRTYFARLEKGARRAKYIYVPRPKIGWVLSHIKFFSATLKWQFLLRYETLILASFDFHTINALARRNLQAKVLSVDDGTANIFPGSVYYLRELPGRSGIYAKAFGGTNIASLKDRIARHYTVFPSLPNVIPAQKLRSLDVWQVQIKENTHRIKRYFVGQRFSEAYGNDYSRLVLQYMARIPLDAYILHPQETRPLIPRTPLLEKYGELAEDAILKDCGGVACELYGGFSTVMLTLTSKNLKRVVLLSRSQPMHESMAELSKESGCSVVWLD